MPLLLLLETATPSCSVALASGTDILAIREELAPNIHASHLTPFITDVLTAAGKSMRQLDGVVISMGPGSYTGLRIGTSTAKGICYALDIPLIAVNTLEGMAYGFAGEGFDELVPMIDARRMEVYTARFTAARAERSPTEAMIVTPASFLSQQPPRRTAFFGSGALKCRELLASPEFVVIEDFVNSASHLLVPALAKYARGKFENVATFEPFYLKDFITTAPVAAF